ncbi:hypothetical protein D3C78_1730260 [compost metagenome]
MLKLNIRIISGYTNDNFSPQTGRFKNVSFINRSQLLAALLSDLKGLTYNTFYFVNSVRTSIYRLLTVLGLATIFLTEIDTASKLTNYNQISTFKYFRF